MGTIARERDDGLHHRAYGTPVVNSPRPQRIQRCRAASGKLASARAACRLSGGHAPASFSFVQSFGIRVQFHALIGLGSPAVEGYSPLHPRCREVERPFHSGSVAPSFQASLRGPLASRASIRRRTRPTRAARSGERTSRRTTAPKLLRRLAPAPCLRSHDRDGRPSPLRFVRLPLPRGFRCGFWGAEFGQRKTRYPIGIAG